MLSQQVKTNPLKFEVAVNALLTFLAFAEINLLNHGFHDVFDTGLDFVACNLLGHCNGCSVLAFAPTCFPDSRNPAA